MEQEKNKSEEESSEEVEYETIRVPVNNAETPNYEKVLRFLREKKDLSGFIF